jgi:hypothetical protein
MEISRNVNRYEKNYIDRYGMIASNTAEVRYHHLEKMAAPLPDRIG